MLSRLTDRVEIRSDGKENKIHRYGMWGTTHEIECRKRGKWVIVSKIGKVISSFRTLAEAEVELSDMVRKGV